MVVSGVGRRPRHDVSVEGKRGVSGDFLDGAAALEVVGLDHGWVCGRGGKVVGPVATRVGVGSCKLHCGGGDCGGDSWDVCIDMWIRLLLL